MWGYTNHTNSFFSGRRTCGKRETIISIDGLLISKCYRDNSEAIPDEVDIFQNAKYLTVPYFGKCFNTICYSLVNRNYDIVHLSNQSILMPHDFHACHIIFRVIMCKVVDTVQLK